MAEDKEQLDSQAEQSQTDAASAEADALMEQALSNAQNSVNQLNELADDETEAAAMSAPMQTPTGIEMLADVDLDVSIELGRTRMLVEDVLKLAGGSVVELDKLAGDPVDVYVNNRLVARGEVLVLNDSFCIRISEIVANLEQEAEDAAREQAIAG